MHRRAIGEQFCTTHFSVKKAALFGSTTINPR
jgi:hypothetical protein